MIQSFGGEAPRDLFLGADSRAARQRIPPIWNRVVRRRLDMLDVARSPRDLASIPGNRVLERTLRVNDRFRVWFEWTDEGPAAVDVGTHRGTERTTLERPARARRPTHPGQVLLHDVIRPLRLTQTEVASRLGISYPRLNEIVHGKRRITPDSALRLAAVLEIAPEVWLDLQQAVDLWDARHPG